MLYKNQCYSVSQYYRLIHMGKSKDLFWQKKQYLMYSVFIKCFSKRKIFETYIIKKPVLCNHLVVIVKFSDQRVQIYLFIFIFKVPI